jgi:hypothetical protein
MGLRYGSPAQIARRGEIVSHFTALATSLRRIIPPVPVTHPSQLPSKSATLIHLRSAAFRQTRKKRPEEVEIRGDVRNWVTRKRRRDLLVPADRTAVRFTNDLDGVITGFFEPACQFHGLFFGEPLGFCYLVFWRAWRHVGLRFRRLVQTWRKSCTHGLFPFSLDFCRKSKSVPACGIPWNSCRRARAIRRTVRPASASILV